MVADPDSHHLLLASPATLLRFASTSASDFHRILALLNASLADLRWLLSLYPEKDDEGAAAASTGVGLSLPPIAANNPILSYVWTCVAAVQIAARPSNRVDAALFLANLALDSHRNRWVIVYEGGIPPLLTLLKNGDDESQLAAVVALTNLSTDHDLVSVVADALAIPAIVETLSNSTSTRLQTQLASLISRMAAADAIAREELTAENAIRSLVALLSNQSSHIFLANCGSDIDEREAKLELKTACAEALWMLCKDSIANSRKVAETVGLLCLAKLLETKTDQLQFDCLMTVMEIATAVESDADLCGSAFKKRDQL